jgi:hypothetical protein
VGASGDAAWPGDAGGRAIGAANAHHPCRASAAVAPASRVVAASMAIIVFMVLRIMVWFPLRENERR